MHKRDLRLSVRVNDLERESVERICREAGINKSDLLRFFLFLSEDLGEKTVVSWLRKVFQTARRPQ